MNKSNPIDTTYDFRSDTPPGKDPDTWSPTLSRYHKLLWSKRLPRGGLFDLTYRTAPFYLHHCSDLGEFWLSSDAVIPTFRKQAALSSVFEQIPDELRSFGDLGYTIGGMMVFPANQINKKWTINQARGCHPLIKDRFDHTVECIRRHYRKEDSPLSDVIARYTDYFELFGDFLGYVEFFLLQDLVTVDCAAVKFFSPFDDFNKSPVPDSMSAYLDYRTLAVDFLQSRNQRIGDWSESHINGQPCAAANGSGCHGSCYF